MKFLIYYFLAFIPKKTKMMLNTYSLENDLPIEKDIPMENNLSLKKKLLKKKKINNQSGFDDRYLNNMTLSSISIENQQKMYKIEEFFEKKKILNTLINENISINIKLTLIKPNSLKGFNLTAGLNKEDYEFIV